MLNRIEIWRLSWPIHDLNLVVLEPGCCLFALVFRVIILLEEDILALFLEILNGA
jgi:hypothetical protein